MKEHRYKNLEGRNKLIEKLTQEYITASASEATIILGNHGSGKSHVVFEVINRIHSKNRQNNKLQVYIAEGDKLSLYENSSKSSVDNIETTISLPIRWGIGVDIAASVSTKKNDSKFNQISNLLKKRFSSDLLICLPDYSKLDNKVKYLIELLMKNITTLESTFKHHLYFLISNVDDSCIRDFLSCSTIEKNVLEDYDENDILQYLIEKHKIIVKKKDIEEKIKQIKKICASNLKLVDFLYIDLVEQNVDFFRALDSVVTYRLGELKKNGLTRNVNEYDMEDIILSSSISLKSFGSQEIASITHKETNTVRESLYLAQKQALLKKTSLNFYSFACDEIRKILKKELNDKNKERYLDYYNYYSNKEQDQYYLRAYYLWAYNGYLKDDIFALLILSYSEALSFNNLEQIKKIERLIGKEKDSYYYDDFEAIKSFYNTLREGGSDYDKLNGMYRNLQKDYFEIPLKAELARAFFHFMYRNYKPWYLQLKQILSQLVQYAEESIYLVLSQYPIEMPRIDETVLKLRIIYDIAPYILDVLNDTELFKRIYDLSLSLSGNIQTSQSSKSIAEYMENVFNRKAFLFVNQTQCNIYYDKAKKYFYDNQIWDEYCITLICEAGTDIVIQKYNEAIQAYRKAMQVSIKNEISIPYPQKILNNMIIADFLRYEQSHTKKYCFRYAKKTVKKLRKQLQRISCATEFVILTNICSLSLYYGNISEYLKFKKYLEHLMDCDDVSNIEDDDVDDFYRYYFAWFEIYRYILDEKWESATEITNLLGGFVPSLFQKQEVFWDKKLLALKEIILNRQILDGYDFCNNLVPLKRRSSELASFFCRGLMLSDLQYTSYD
ncbi:hypothetical protein DWY88_18655 [Mediterraneibacter gnavus]|uniref:Uncharacterized protein n=1 Tax=Mediterraneibacter gnavus TaxID=33038 RepID=A0A412BLM8_MEDGN|nr:hypothetical protein [Mediterraneibacter gnavus]RGQ56536.1 hypothetical protein DWY88_18655 [Mediterraneibacter gnavus]